MPLLMMTAPRSSNSFSRRFNFHKCCLLATATATARAPVVNRQIVDSVAHGGQEVQGSFSYTATAT
eukprot:scaffold267366_cov19-Tisochrysis_lutea.AAC.1